MSKHIYDVALSFAGEDRPYVRQIADFLRSNGIRVFFDEYERANLLGKELISFLEDIYKNKARFVIVFASKSYLLKDWTNHELRSALNRAFSFKHEYVLPIKLDNTKLPGLHDSIGYLSTTDFSLQAVCEILLEKLGAEKVSSINPERNFYRITKYKYARDLSGETAKKIGGRWNHKGISALYASPSIAVGALTFILQIPTSRNANYVITKLIVPSNLKIDKIYEADLPEGWRTNPHNEVTQQIGSEWLLKNESCILEIPNSIVPDTVGYVLNPKNENFKFIEVGSIQPFELDERL
jgi:RES domain-containing protein